MTPGSLLFWCGWALAVSLMMTAFGFAKVFFSSIDDKPPIYSLVAAVVGALVVNFSIAGLIAGFIWFLVDKYTG